ncbi:hypothetical protein ABPG72_009657 [Tetrahymena utriculariae]
MNQEVLEARKKLQEKIGDSRTGGKGTQRRKVKKVTKTQITDDKKLKTVIKKFGVQPFQGIDEVNMFKDDKTILHFERPEVLASIQNNTFVVIGKSETKNVKDLLPDILQHLGPKQLGDLKDLLATMGGEKKEKVGDDEEIPTLESNFEEATKKVD